MSAGWYGLATKIFITVWLIVISVWDRMHRRVPNLLVLPAMLAGLVWQTYQSIEDGQWNRMLFIVVAWTIVFMLWRLHVFGGGDAKLLMALFGFFPTLQFLVLFSVVVLIASVPLLIHKYARRGLKTSLRSAGQRISQGRVLPTEEELQTEGSPHCWSLALPGVIYLWLVL
jgi:Flp pilus assembly protein protease CpaA